MIDSRQDRFVAKDDLVCAIEAAVAEIKAMGKKGRKAIISRLNWFMGIVLGLAAIMAVEGFALNATLNEMDANLNKLNAALSPQLAERGVMLQNVQEKPGVLESPVAAAVPVRSEVAFPAEAPPSAD